MLAYNESAHAFVKWDPAKGEYPNLVLFAIWVQRSQDQSASDEYGRFIVPPGANDAHVVKADTRDGLAAGLAERLTRHADSIGGFSLSAAFAATLVGPPAAVVHMACVSRPGRRGPGRG